MPNVSLLVTATRPSFVGDLRRCGRSITTEQAFGLLDAKDRLTAERRLERDAAFAANYRRWQAYAAAIIAGTAESPPSSLWPSIQARLAADDGPGRPASSTLRRWQAGTAVAVVFATDFGAVALHRQRPPSPRPEVVRMFAPVVAMLKGKTSAVVAVSYDRSTNHLTILPTALEIGHHSAQLWVIPRGGQPRSLGVIDADRSRWISTPASASLLITSGATLAISLDPSGGSPTGKPTGPVILSGIAQLS